MSKRHNQFIFTSIGIALSFLIALGGWRLTIELLGIKESALLSETGSVRILKTEGNNKEGTKQNFPVLTETEMFKVLQNWESDAMERPHEPVDEQLNMEQAINAGKAGLSYFFKQGIIPAELLEYDKTNAYLCEKKWSVQEVQSLSPYYSYWRITFSAETRKATLTINAMTGQIWNAEISRIGTDEIEVEKVLDAFISYLDLDNSGSYTTDGTTASKSFSDGMLHAVAISRTAATVTTDTKVESQSLLLVYLTTLYLTTQTPITE